jgi:dTDP-L-rhamnose 4-epimerase
MRILITGGAGFIGSRLVMALNDAGHQLTVLDSLSPQVHGAEARRQSTLFQSIEGRAKFIEGSVTEESSWVEALAGQDAVVHLAAETGTGQSMYEIKHYVDVNVGGTALMLNVLRADPGSVRKVVVASSRALYGEGKYRSRSGDIVYPSSRRKEDLEAGRFDLQCADTGEPLEVLATDEESRLHPSSVYGIAKLGQEQLVMTVCASLGIAASALRYQNVYGPGQSLSNPYTGILSIFSKRILSGDDINIFEDGMESRDFVYIDDVVRATSLALFSERADGQVFGIGSGVRTTVLQAAQTLCSTLGRSVELKVSGAFRLGDIRHNFADLSKARKLLGFEPLVPFDSGIDRFVEWVANQPRTPDGYEQSLVELRSKGLMRG